MRSVTFRPLRRVKNTGKIVVASYMAWNRLRTSDYNEFNLTVLDDYKKLPPEEYVYNHKGELLFFFKKNPADIPVYNSETMDLDALDARNEPFGIYWHGSDNHVNYSRCDGMDCAGTPTFTHWTEEYISREDTWRYYGPDKFEPLTVKTVVMWWGWFLFQLNNSRLQIGNKK